MALPSFWIGRYVGGLEYVTVGPPEYYRHYETSHVLACDNADAGHEGQLVRPVPRR